MKIKMTKLFFACIITIASLNIANAQYEKGDKLLNIGIGNSYWYSALPIGATLEVGITDEISVGGQVDYASAKSGGFGWTSSYIGGRGSYHLNKILNLNEDKLDTYAGLGLGISSFKWKDNSSIIDPNFGGLDINYFVGARYYFKQNLGAFLEAGQVGISRFKIGVSLKF